MTLSGAGPHLSKAGIVAAGSAAALLALSPLAFADEAVHPTICPSTALTTAVGELLGLLSPGPGVDDGATSGGPVCSADSGASRTDAP